ncbi:PilZ domain-containing protein [Bradyrhizobium canariense]|uniref:PilZ domain-containing protein n=1 Tax=Bradyrhizobium canariense TaxID=255045 RepID=UPI000A194FD3|nr:PilZ domain-containing protein [Bradyrhizobium canariense]OSI33704.1 pilus assembly protein PilZ [Bradyrhizobium canariense]OSI36895.1 pilus assembly protein PilZ [Bradyrhizobium canariense]OSI50923.1 pilus assembly protein PilZ [Bradyrhizobium canariense]OSI56927.1 pilus assembly protein PilZ [Bradyrhizobium canariense]OSI59641.1 pilus assembly protein PilZ [Bradyrhizobium canariense]
MYGWDKRRSKRVRFDHEYRATVLGFDGTWRHDCILIDVSETGARLRIDGSTDVLKTREFFLLLSTTGLSYRRCELIRLDGSEIGVQFVTSRTIRSGP